MSIKSTWSIRCKVDSGNWVEVYRDSNDTKCPWCKLDIRVTSKHAMHEPVAWIDCSVHDINESEWEYVGLWQDEEYTPCAHCRGEVWVKNGEAHHEEMEWVECPLYPDKADTLVRLGEDTDEDDPRHCNNCKEEIVVENGSAQHSEIFEVECPETGNSTYFTHEDFAEDDEWDCECCDGEIWMDKDGDLHHEILLEELHSSKTNKALILIHGVGSAKEEMDYSDWTEQVLKGEFRGNIFGFHWQSEAFFGGRFSYPIVVKSGVIESEGQRLAQALFELIQDYRSVSVLGFSLGCRVILFALRKLHSWGIDEKVRVHLCGGAVPRSMSWRKASMATKGKIYNYYSEEDNALKYWYLIGEFFLTKHAIGVEGINADPPGKICNVPAVEAGDWVDHEEYEYKFSFFSRLK